MSFAGVVATLGVCILMFLAALWYAYYDAQKKSKKLFKSYPGWEMSEWRGMDTAPKDGQEFLASIDGKLVKIAFWYKGPHPAFSRGEEEDRKRGYYPRWANSAGEGSLIFVEPDGWMPIPKPFVKTGYVK